MSNYTGHLEAPTSVAGGHDVVSHPWGWLQNLRTTLHRSHERRVAIRELSALSDRQLDDIGVVRAQIPEIVYALSASKSVEEPVADKELVVAGFGADCCVGHS